MAENPEVLLGDCRVVLPMLEAKSVQCCVTSPPYYGLRDYGTAQWEGGEAGCDHKRFNGYPSGLQGSKESTYNGKFEKLVCGKCGARRIDSQLGLESTPEEYIANMVAVFRAVWRVLRDDGTLWLNLGSSYSTGVGSDLCECLNRLLEKGSIFFANADSVTLSAHRISVAPNNQSAPNSVLSGFFGLQRDGIKNGNQNFGEIIDLFATPRDRSISGLLVADSTNGSYVKMSPNGFDHSSIVVSDLNSQTEPEFAVAGTCRARPSKNNKTSFSIGESDEPSVGEHVRRHTTWDTFASAALRKGLIDIDFVDQTVSFRNRFNTLTGLLCDFRITKATDKKLTFISIFGGLELSVSDVRHIWFVLNDGSIVPYSVLYGRANRKLNQLRPKQDLCIPWRVAIALQEDGWILRSPIIWHKPNPMPESVTDRPTKAHEYIFLLTKAERYFYDAEAIREPSSILSNWHESYPVKAARNGQTTNGTGKSTMGHEVEFRNKRSVWTIATQPYAEAHFATFPEEIPKLCILAGSKPGDVILDPFAGSGTVGQVALELGRRAVVIELNPAYIELARDRTLVTPGFF